jgi:hypothetical protein
VSIFEGITGIFQDAHFSKKVSIFEQGEHLRQGTALGYPLAGAVPFLRKVALPRVAASMGLSAYTHTLLAVRPALPQARCDSATSSERGQGPQENKKAAPSLRARLRLGEILQLSLYRVIAVTGSQYCVPSTAIAPSSHMIHIDPAICQYGNFLPRRGELAILDFRFWIGGQQRGGLRVSSGAP